MEQYLDEVLAELRTIENDEVHMHDLEAKTQYNLKILMEYYDSGLWLHDYECDERGELPADLKRGVLAEDTLYNLFSDFW